MRSSIKVTSQLKKSYFSVFKRVMKNSSLILVLFFLQSCNYFQVKKITKESVIQDQIETLDWNDVDAYPSFVICDSLQERDDKRACFETELTNHFFLILNDESIVVDEDINETIYLDLLITEKGVVSISDKTITEKTRQIIPDIDAYLLKSVESLPQVYPAIKRGQQVKTQFKLPIQLQVESL